MHKRLILTIFVVMFLAGAVLAQAPTPQKPTLPFYWISGEVYLPANPPMKLPDRYVFFYKDNISDGISVETESDGTYKLNVFELYYYKGVPITFETESYHLAVPRTSSNFANGTEEVVTLPAAEGYLLKNLAVVDGGGPFISEGPLTIETSVLLPGEVGKSYTSNLVARGGTPPYSWSIKSGSLPAGLTLDSVGNVHGIPEQSGTFTFEVECRDSSAVAAFATREVMIVINPSPVGPLTIVTNSLPDGEVGKPYSVTLQATGGTPPYSWSIDSGSLPAGLNLDVSTGRISGTPTAVETANFTVKCLDSKGNNVTRQLSIVITTKGNGPKITITVFLQGLYDPDKGIQKPTTVQVEARDKTDRKIVKGFCVIPLDQNGTGSNNGYWNATPPDGEYYLVIKHKISNIDAGRSHLPVITSKTFLLDSNNPIAVDFSSGRDIYEEANKFPAMATVASNKKALWAGDMNGDGYVNVIDVGVAWYYLFKEFNKGTPPANLDPNYPTYDIADLDGNSLVNVIDVGNPWFAAFNVLKNYNGPHTYVP